MYFKKPYPNRYTLTASSGFTLVEVIMTVLIVSILTLGIYRLIDYSIKITADNKHRVAATVISNQKLERIRNLPYDSVGTVSGLVQGVLQGDEIVVQGTNSYSVNIFIKYEDDSFDGTDSASGGTDDIPTDYKIANVTVGWVGPFGSKTVVSSTVISPRGLEADTGGGTLQISVFDANGLPVDSASVHVENNLTDPVINFDSVTNASGLLAFYGAATSTEGYEISITKTNYSESSTTARTVDNPNPTKPHASIFEDQKTEISFGIDLLSDLTIRTINQDLLDNWQINTDIGDDDQTKPVIGIDSSGNYYFVWQDYRGGSSSKIYAQKYDTSKNQVWVDDKVIGTANGTIEPEIAVDSVGNLYIAWNDDSNGNQDAYLVKLDSSGSDIWGSTKKVNTDVSSKDQTNPSIALTESGGVTTTTIAWQDNRGVGWDIYVQKIEGDGDYTWGSEVLVNTDGTATDQYYPTVITDSADNAYIIWTDERNGDKDVYAQKYSPAGVKIWTNDIKVNNDLGVTDQYSPVVDIDSSGNLYFAWADERNGDKDVYAQKYSPAGVKIWTNDIKVNNDGGVTDQYSPDVAIDCGGDIYFAWTDERNGDSDIYAGFYDLDGVSYWTDDIRVNINNGTSNQSSPRLTINPDTCEAYACWYDERAGEYDIYASKVGTYGGSLNIANVPVTITSEKRIGEDPVIYKYKKTYTSDGSGYINLTNIEWDAYSIDLEAGYTDYSIVMSEPTRPLYLPPNDTQEIILYLEP
jgi:prepilin-type N-terminal cleavage/methylation domain-containing protein